MTLTELAARSGVDVGRIRYYQRRGVLHAPAAGRSACYDATHIERLEFIRRMLERGLGLEEIRAGAAGETRELVRRDGTFRRTVELVTLTPSVELRTPPGYFTDAELEELRENVAALLERRGEAMR